MKIALIGYGKMGKEIEAIAIARKHQVVLKVDKDNANSVTEKDLKLADVAIEFSAPDAAIDNIRKCLSFDLPIVVGTTGWYQHFEEIKKLCTEKHGSLFHATNF